MWSYTAFINSTWKDMPLRLANARGIPSLEDDVNSFIYRKLNGLAHEVFEIDCRRQNLRYQIDQLEEKLQELTQEVHFYHPSYNDETIHLDNLVLLVSPMDVTALTREQFDKIEPQLERNTGD